MDQPWWQDVMIPGQPYNDPDNSKRRFDATLDMITRYMMGNTVKASDYETHITAQLSTGVSDPEERETVTAWFKGFDGKSAEELNDPGTEYEVVPWPRTSRTTV